MTGFIKENFCGSGAWVNYDVGDTRSKFVARFKYQRGGKSSFITFLCKNFTVEEYFSRLEAGEPPLQIVGSKGYLLPHIKRLLKQEGYPVSREGMDMFVQRQLANNRTA